MASEPTSLSEREERFGEIAFAYLRAREEGRRPEPHEWLARYPEFAAELASFFADQKEMDRVGAPLREMAGVVDRPSTEGPAATVAQDDTARPGAPPSRFGDYEVVGELARGGMGVVHRARQRGLNRLVALKVVRAGEWASPEEVRRFRNEAEMVALLDHPNIVPVYEVGEQAGQLYFSMKLVEGGSLARQPGRFRDDPRAAAGLLATVARAVHHAHQRGVLHRDLKPSNILLDEESRPHVTDFGLARRVEADSSLTQSGAIVGTPSYMAPEQATGEKGAVTTATDVYGLGAVLYALLTGRPPFQAENVLETLVQVREREPAPPGGVNRRVARDLETICLKCLSKEPQRRYGSALALAEDLERFLAGQSIQARPVGVWERGVKWARRRPLAVAAVVGLVAALVLLGAGAGWVLGDRSARRREAESKVLAALNEAAERLSEGNPYDPVLIAAVQRAEAQRDAGAVGPELQGRVRQLRRDLDMLLRLEEAYLQMAGSNRGFDSAGADRLYTEAFQEYGLDATFPDTEKAAEQVRTSAIRLWLVLALDNWSDVRGELANGSGAPQTAVADRADDDPWRQGVRRALARRDRAALAGLAREPAALRQPPASVVWLSRYLLPLRPVECVQLLRAAQRRHPADFWINFHLGAALGEKKPPDLGEAISFNRAALALRPQCYVVLHNLVYDLRGKGQIDEVIAQLRESIRFYKDRAKLHTDLGKALGDTGQLDEAITEFREALRIAKERADAHYNTLVGPPEPESLPAGLKEAWANAHYNLGTALALKGQLDEAIMEHREAIRLKPDYAEAHINLGGALARKGQFAEALTYYRRAHELGSKDPHWIAPSAEWVKNIERLIELDAKLPRVLKGEVQPADVGERLALASMCQEHKSLYLAAVRFYTDAFAEQPKLADDLQNQLRYNAACAAALAGCGQGKDAGGLPDKEYVGLRRQAVEWLRADLAAYRQLLQKEPDKVGPEIHRRMQHWQQDTDLAGVRGPDALAKLPEAERQEWQKLWQEVEALRTMAAGSPKP